MFEEGCVPSEAGKLCRPTVFLKLKSFENTLKCKYEQVMS